MKYEHTSDINIKRHPNTKTFYFRKGQTEQSLKTQDWEQAVLRKKLLLADLDFAGEVAFKHTVNDLYPIYALYKKEVRDGRVRKARRISRKTYQEIEYVFSQHLLRFFGRIKIGKITPGAWSKYVDQAQVSDLANHRKVLLGFLNWCVVKEYLKTVPKPLPLSHHERRKRKIITPIQLEKIFEQATGSILLFLSLALYNGLRRTEIMTLSISGVDTEARHLTVHKMFNKKRRDRSIPINDIVSKLLKERIEEIRSLGLKTNWIFPNLIDSTRHADPGGLKTAWNTVKARSGVTDVTWHDFRATFEKHMNSSSAFSDVQKEKFADATMDVQKKIYITMDHDDLRGLEDSVCLPKVAKIIAQKQKPSGLARGWK